MAIAVFYISLVGIMALFLLKSVEMRRGSRPFSHIQERVDAWFHDMFHKAGEMVRYLNWKTIFLLVVFLAKEFWRGLLFSYSWFKKTRLFQNLRERIGGRGGHIFPKEKNGNVSPFLSKIKEEGGGNK